MSREWYEAEREWKVYCKSLLLALHKHWPTTLADLLSVTQVEALQNLQWTQSLEACKAEIQHISELLEVAEVAPRGLQIPTILLDAPRN